MPIKTSVIRTVIEILKNDLVIDENSINLSIKNDAVVIPILSVVVLILKLGSSSGLPEWGLKRLVK